MAADIPGEVPFFQDEVVRAKLESRGRQKKLAREQARAERNAQIQVLSDAGKGRKKIAHTVGCSVSTVVAFLDGKVVRRGRTVDAVSVDSKSAEV
jgi:hypothetical protein